MHAHARQFMKGSFCVELNDIHVSSFLNTEAFIEIKSVTISQFNTADRQNKYSFKRVKVALKHFG